MPFRSGLTTWLLASLLTGCSYYFDAAPDRQLVHRVEERMQNEESLPVEKLSKPPQL